MIKELFRKLNPFKKKESPSDEAWEATKDLPVQKEFDPALLEALAEEVMPDEPEETLEIPPTLPPHRMVDSPNLAKAEQEIAATLRTIDGMSSQNKELKNQVRRLALCLKAHREALWTYISSVVKVTRNEEPNPQDFQYFEDLRVISEFSSRVLDIAERLGLAVSDLFVGIYGGSIEDKLTGLSLTDDQVLALVETNYRVDTVLQRVDERERTLEEVIEAFQKREAEKEEKKAPEVTKRVKKPEASTPKKPKKT